jgi:hypothetical protein
MTSFDSSLASVQPQSATYTTTSNAAASSSSGPAHPTIDTVFREYLYRNCRDSLFWLEAERYRMNPAPQKATFILRTFFTEGGEFYLTREDFPAQFDPLFSKQRPVSPGSLILEAQDHLKTRLIQLLGPAFMSSTLMQKWNANPAVAISELSVPANGGSLSVFLSPRPTSTVIPPAQLTAVNQPMSPTSVPTLPVATPSAELARSVSPPGRPGHVTHVTIPVPDHLRISPPLNSNAGSMVNGAPVGNASSSSPPPTTSQGTTSPRSFVVANPSQPRDAIAPSDTIMGSAQYSSANQISTHATSMPSLPLNSSSSSINSSTGVASAPGTPTGSSSGGALPQASSQGQLQLPSLSASQLGPVSLANRPKGLSSSNSSNNLNNSSALDRRPSRGSLVDETITSARVSKGLTPSSPAPLKASSQPARVNVIQLVGAVRDKVGLAKKDKERHEREKYFDPTSNGWMLMEVPTLDDLIQDANMMILYYDFLKTIHAEENLLAWIDIELYKSSSASRESRRNAGVDLLVRFFEPTSKSLINIEGVNYKDILKELNERPSRDLFDVAQRVLWDQLAFQCYVRFKESESMRRLFEESTIKGKKKELLKMAQKAVKASSDNASFMTKLEEFAKFKGGFVAFVPNVSDREFQLEDVLYSSDLLVAFREYLNTLNNAAEYLDALNFWFDVEVWKYTAKDNLKEVALNILREYLLPPASGGFPKISILGYDTKPLEVECNERPDKNTFSRLQFWVWRKLKLEQFHLFEHSETLTKFFAGDLPMRQNIPIVRHCETLNELRSKVANDAQFKANSAKVYAKIRIKRQEIQGTNFELDYLLADREYVQILCEFMDKRQARENLAFWTEAEYYKYLISPAEKAVAASKIWDRYFSDKAEIHINVDVSDKTALQTALKDPNSLPYDLFVDCQDTIYGLIAFDLIPKFSVSEQGARLLKVIKRRPPNVAQASFKMGGLEAVKDLRSWLGNE